MKKNFWKNLLFTIAGVLMAAHLIPGVEYRTPAALVVAALILGLFNATLKPLLLIGALPFVVLTLGFGLWLINAGLLGLAAWLVEGFDVRGFWSALGGAAIISLTQMMLTVFTGGTKVQVSRGIPGSPRDATPPTAAERDGVNRLPRGPGRGDRDDPKDVIDI